MSKKMERKKLTRARFRESDDAKCYGKSVDPMSPSFKKKNL